MADAARNFLRDGKLNEAIEALAVAMDVPWGTSSPRSGAASKYFESILTTLATLECSKREQLPQQLNPRTTPHEIRWQHHGARVFVFPPYFCVFLGEVSYQQYKSASAFLNGRKGP